MALIAESASGSRSAPRDAPLPLAEPAAPPLAGPTCSLAPHLALAAALLLAGLGAFSIDLTVSRFFVDVSRSSSLPRDDLLLHQAAREGRRLLDLSEIFAHGLGVLLLAVALFALDPAGRRCLPRILLCAYLGGLAAISIKLAIARVRPLDFNFDGGVWSSFAAIRPWFDHTAAWAALGVAGREVESFPSGHAATAAGFAAALAWRYPHGRWLFVLAAVLAACQRIAAGAHYLSDVFLGAALGLAVAALLLAPGCLGGWLARAEERLFGPPLFGPPASG